MGTMGIKKLVDTLRTLNPDMDIRIGSDICIIVENINDLIIPNNYDVETDFDTIITNKDYVNKNEGYDYFYLCESQ